jgi:SAM-dependent methyltransferase
MSFANTIIRTMRANAVTRRLLPEKTRSRVACYLTRRRFDRFMAQAFPQFTPDRTGRFDAPVPPPDITVKTSGLDKASWERKSPNPQVHRNDYLKSGYGTVVGLLRHAQLCGVDLWTIKTVFDFGCGDGRLIRHFRNIRGIRIVGSDTRAEAIQWCQQTLPGPEYHVNAFNPPLDFLGDSSVDLTYALSVFTHIPLKAQEAWLEELYRITRPGGLLLLTLKGRRLKQTLSARRSEELERIGELEISSTDPEAHLATQLKGSLWDIYQSRERIFEVFGKIFEIADYVDEDITSLGQDLLILRKSAVQEKRVRFP